jgi:hypothetical protein
MGLAQRGAAMAYAGAEWQHANGGVQLTRNIMRANSATTRCHGSAGICCDGHAVKT